jgi:hypothetical protein
MRFCAVLNSDKKLDFGVESSTGKPVVGAAASAPASKANRSNSSLPTSTARAANAAAAFPSAAGRQPLLNNAAAA